MTISDKLLTPNPMSRPNKKMGEIKGVVVHYVANPGSTAVANRNYFENLKNQSVTYASSHYIIGLDGEIIRCIPENEVAYHAGNANSNYIGIECCHPDSTGKFNNYTYTSLVELTADILKRYNVKDIKRHYDITGKICPKYYVENSGAWEQVKGDILNYSKGGSVKVEVKTVDEAVKVLVDKGVVNSPEYWLEAVKCVKYLDGLIVNMANKL